MIDCVETDVACRHQWKDVYTSNGYEDGLKWCSICGTIEYFTVSMDPLTIYIRGRLVPEVSRGFVNAGDGI